MRSSNGLDELAPYGEFLAIHPSHHTRRNYQQDLAVYKSFLDQAGIKDPTAAKPADLTRFAGLLTKPGKTPKGTPRKAYSTRSMKRILATTRSLYRFLASTQRITTDPTAVFHYFKIRSPQRNPRPLPPSSRIALLKSLKSNDLDDLKVSLAVRLGFECGLRVSEIAGIRRKDIDLKTMTINVIGKGDKQRGVPITQALKRQLEAFYEGRKGNKNWRSSIYLFPSPRTPTKPIHIGYLEGWLKTAAHWADLPEADDITIHVLRHTFGTCLAEAGASVYEIRDLMGHSSIAVSENYVKLSSTQARTSHQKAFGQYAVKVGSANFAPEILRRHRNQVKSA